MTGLRPSSAKRGSGGTPEKRGSKDNRPSFDERRAEEEEKANSGGVLGGLLGGLPPMIRDLLPFDTGGAGEQEKEIAGPPKDKRTSASWQDVCFIHSIPGKMMTKACWFLVTAACVSSLCAKASTPCSLTKPNATSSLATLLLWQIRLIQIFRLSLLQEICQLTNIFLAISVRLKLTTNILRLVCRLHR